jgi:anti-sigma factor (TIGR02949 family)
MSGSAECRMIRERLDAFMDRELEAPDAQTVERHIDDCSGCAEELRTMKDLQTRLRSAAGNETASDELRRRVTAAIREGRRSEAGSRFWMPAAVAATLAIAFAVSWTTLRTWNGSDARRIATDQYLERLQTRLASVVRVAMNDHIHCAVFRAYPKNPPPREQMVSDMGPAFKDLIAIVRDKIPQRYRLEQAHRCTVRGRHYMHMIFRNESALISLIATVRRPGESLAQMAEPEGAALRIASVDQYQIAAFNAGAFLAYVISDLPKGDNLEMASVLAPPVAGYLTAVDPARAF